MSQFLSQPGSQVVLPQVTAPQRFRDLAWSEKNGERAGTTPVVVNQPSARAKLGWSFPPFRSAYRSYVECNTSSVNVPIHASPVTWYARVAQRLVRYFALIRWAPEYSELRGRENFFAAKIRDKLRLARSVRRSASGSIVISLNPFRKIALLERPGSGKRPRKGGNDPGFALLTARTKDVRAGRSRPFAKNSTIVRIPRKKQC